MNPERPRNVGDNSNVVDFAAEKLKRENAAKEAEEIIEQDSIELEHFDFSQLPLVPPITPEELESLQFLPRRDD